MSNWIIHFLISNIFICIFTLVIIGTKKLLKKYGIEVIAHVTQIGDIKAKEFDKETIEKNVVRCGDEKAAKEMEDLIIAKKSEGNSVGGVVEIMATGVPVGLGEPIFGKIDGDIAEVLMSIGAVKGVEIGSGFEVAAKLGSENNDEIGRAHV